MAVIITIIAAACVCVSEQRCFPQCVGGVISLLYVSPLKSLFKG